MKKNLNLKNFYNKVYRRGETKHFTNFIASGTNTSEASEILKEMDWRGKKIIDVGCGTGYFAYLAARKGANVLGVDYSKEAINIAQRKYKHKNLSFRQLNASVEIPSKYDVIVSIGTLEHMDNPLRMLRLFKNHLRNKGCIIITSPNWTNPRGYILMTLWHLFNAPITLADLHYLTPIDFMKWAKKLNMRLKWRTIERSWAHGDVLIKDFRRRIPNVLRDTQLPKDSRRINNFIKWLKENILPFDNSLPHSGAIGLYVFFTK